MLKILKGAVIIFLLFLLTDNLEFLAMSIICTGGISLVVYLPLAYLIGFIIDKVVDKFRGKTKKDATNEAKSNNQKALENFILESSAQGVSKEEIIKKLEQSGWDKLEIEKALNSVGK